MQFLSLCAVRVHVVFLMISMILFTTGCEDDNHDHDYDEGHTDADGFVLEDESGTGIYTEFEGTIEGSVTIIVGDTLELSVHFLDHEQNEIEHDEEEQDEDELTVSGNDSNIAVVEVENNEEGEEEHHEMAIHIIGVSAGSTSFKLQLMHNGHADYTSTNNVPVIVN